MNSQQYARQAAEFFHPSACGSIHLYAPIAARALELGLQVREGGNSAGPVVALIGEMTRHLLAPSVVCAASAPAVDFEKLDRVWSKPSSRGRYLASMSALQQLAASYVQNAWTMPTDPARRTHRLGVMAREAYEILEHLAVIAGHHGYALSDVAEWDIESLTARSAATA